MRRALRSAPPCPDAEKASLLHRIITSVLWVVYSPPHFLSVLQMPTTHPHFIMDYQFACTYIERS